MQAGRNTTVTTMLTLVIREFREQRLLFLLVPLGLVVFIQFFQIASLFEAGNRMDYMLSLPAGAPIEGRLSLARPSLEEQLLFNPANLPASGLERLMNSLFESRLFLLHMAYWYMVLYYFLMTLYGQRLNRSILFWSSMPVSNTQTVTSKLLAGYVVAGGVYVLAVLATLLLLMLSLAVFGWLNELPVAPLFANAHLGTRGAEFLVHTLVAMLWCLPVHGALLLASSWAKRAPFAWVMAVPVLVVFIEMVFSRDFSGRVQSRILNLLVSHTWPVFGTPNPLEPQSSYATMWTTELLWSVLLGSLLIALAIRFNRVDE